MLKKENMHPKLARFIEEVEDIINNNFSEEKTTNLVAEKMRNILEDSNIFPEAYKKPNPEKYTLYPVYIAPDNSFSIASAVWDVGQSTPIHDHGTWGVIGLIQGSEKEIHFELPISGKPKPIQERHLNEGEVMVCCTTDKDVHRVFCTSEVPTVGIHVYGGNIGEIQRHMIDEETGKMHKVVTAWDPIPTN